MDKKKATKYDRIGACILLGMIVSHFLTIVIPIGLSSLVGIAVGYIVYQRIK